MYFLIEEDDSLENHNAIWDNISADVKNEFGSEPVYNRKKDENYYPQVFLTECKYIEKK